MTPPSCSRRRSVALKIAGGALVLLCLALNEWFCEAYLFPLHNAWLKVEEPMRIQLRLELLYKFQVLGVLAGLAMIFWNYVARCGRWFSQTRMGRLFVARPNYRLWLAVVPLLAAETIYWIVACRCDEIPWSSPLTLTAWLNGLVLSGLVFLLLTVALTKVLQFRYMPLLAALVWAVLIAADALLYWYGNTRFEAKYLGMATGDSLPGFASPGLIAFVLAIVGLCLATGALLLKPVGRASWAAPLRIGALLALVWAVHLPYQVFSLIEMTLDARIPSTPGVVADRYKQLCYIGQDPVVNAAGELLFRERLGVLTSLDGFEAFLEHYNLPLGQQRYEPIETRPFRRVIVVMCESLSSFFLKSQNPKLPESITPFLDSQAGESLFRGYRTSAQPTTQALAVTFCSHPNPELLLDSNMPGAFAGVLRDHGWHTVFFSSATKYFDGKGRHCANAGFEEFFGAEVMSEDPQNARYRIDWGMCDRILYRCAADYLAAHRDEPTFMTIEGADTHVPEGRTNYGDLEYPDAPAWIEKNPLAGFLRSVFRLDYDLKNFVERLKAEGLWDEDTLLIVTADHCFPACPVLKTLPGTSGSPFERIPLLMLSPRALPPADRDRPASQLDLAPSLLHLLGSPVPQGYWGKSLFDPRPNGAPFVGIFRKEVTITNGRLSESFDLYHPSTSLQEGLSILLRLYLNDSGGQKKDTAKETSQ